jgi:hypothetical protein
MACFAESLAETSNPETPQAKNAERTVAESMAPCRVSRVSPRTENGMNSVLRVRRRTEFIPFPPAERSCLLPLRHAWAVLLQNSLA